MSSASLSTERIALKISDLEARLRAENAASEREVIPAGLPLPSTPGSLRLSRPRLRKCPSLGLSATLSSIYAVFRPTGGHPAAN
jgi:hypothetical protein